jgi:hypothetical protein
MLSWSGIIYTLIEIQANDVNVDCNSDYIILTILYQKTGPGPHHNFALRPSLPTPSTSSPISDVHKIKVSLREGTRYFWLTAW